MTTRPAYQETLIVHGHHAVRLRPTLGAAAQLEATFGFDTLFRRVEQFDTRTMAVLIRGAARDEGQADALLTALAEVPLGQFVRAAHGPALDLCRGFLPAAPQDSPRSKPATLAPALPWGEAYRALYKAATGVLHWTPDAAWNATPTEIVDALDAHLTHLKALHGSADEEETLSAEQQAENEALGLDPEFDREGLRTLKGKLYA